MFPDALTGGAHMALENGPLLLSTTNKIPPTTWQTIREAALMNDLSQIAAFGGSAVLSDGVVKAQIASAVTPHVISYTNHLEAF